jgi:hypothetical protein
VAGQRDEAAKILAALIASSHEGEGAFGVAIVYEGLGDYDNAFAWLDKSWGRRSPISAPIRGSRESGTD